MTIADKLLHQIRLEGTIFCHLLIDQNWIIIIIDTALLFFQFYSIISPLTSILRLAVDLLFKSVGVNDPDFEALIA